MSGRVPGCSTAVAEATGTHPQRRKQQTRRDRNGTLNVEFSTGVHVTRTAFVMTTHGMPEDPTSNAGFERHRAEAITTSPLISPRAAACRESMLALGQFCMPGGEHSLGAAAKTGGRTGGKLLA
jgi:hypothetical protein